MKYINWFMQLLGWFVFLIVWQFMGASEKISKQIDDIFLMAYDGGFVRYFILACVVYAVYSALSRLNKARKAANDNAD